MDASLKVEDALNMKRARLINSSFAWKTTGSVKKSGAASSSGRGRGEGGGGVLYWMSRDQRVHDNWGLLYAQQLALKHSAPLMVCFCLVPRFLEATIRQYGFLMKGLQEVEKELKRLKIPFLLELGTAHSKIPSVVKERGISAVVCDFSPLRVPLSWVRETGKVLDKECIPLVQVDAHNIVPCWVTSNKMEYAARTIRSKVHSHLSEFLTEIPPIKEHPLNKGLNHKDIDWLAADCSLKVDRSVEEVMWAKPGFTAGIKMLDEFCEKRLKNYSTKRNDPNMDGLSNLSPWYHFGQLSVQRAILRVKKHSKQYSKSVEAYIEEAVVRRELADNFCFYNDKYDSVTGAAQWAQDTLRVHSKDKREYIYSQEELEHGQTHDPLWNAAQLQMTREGKMHGFMRMYWAKKILEWTPSPEEALRIAIYLNDRYELDGRDPNGYVGCMWSICGIHDQGWAERKVFGKIRYMNYAGCKRKFDVGGFERKYTSGKRKKGSLEEYIGGKAGASTSKVKKEK